MKQTGLFPIELKNALKETILVYQDPKYLETDPISFPHKYSDPFDIEIVALLSCLYAYGNVKAIRNFLNDFLQHLGPSPYYALARRTKEFELCYRKISYYRFQTKKDNQLLLLTLSKLAQAHCLESKKEPLFENLFLIDAINFDPLGSLSQFQKKIESLLLENMSGKSLSRGLRFLIGDPKAKSARKRLCLFLRWMVRRAFPDFGLYQKIHPKDLAFPLDVHIQRLIRILGISNRKTYNFQDGILVRDFFKNLNPTDPLLYDFYLTRVGMIQKCQGKKIDAVCSVCSLRKVCLIGSATGN